jgi:hypothetical protein
VHDDRGNASVRWREAPQDYERPVLEVVREQGATPRSEEGCNPYNQRGDGTTLRQLPAAAPRPARTDLRRLSEHIKKMRELEARRRDQDE